MKNKAYIGNCPNCGRECMSGLKTTSCWHCGTGFTIPTDMQEISYVNGTSIEAKGCDNDLSKLLIELAERCLRNNSDTIHLTLNTPKSNLHCFIKFSTEKKAEVESQESEESEVEE